jgi:MOSC domain-containing protein YiiM
MIQAIFIAPEPKAPQQAVGKINVTARKGIVGDRNYDQHRWHGQNITLIEIENIDNFNQQYQQQIAIEDTRRNIITQGISLNELVGEEFSIGPIKLLGTELCEPCHALSQQLASDTISKQQILKAFTHKAGIRATILSSGKITIDMPIIIPKLK